MDADGLLGRREPFQHLRLGLRGPFGTFIDVRGSLATTVDPWTPTVFLRGRRDTFSTAGWRVSFATSEMPAEAWRRRWAHGAAPPARFTWQALYFRYLHRCPRKLGNEGGPMDADGRLRGRRDTFCTSGSVCVAGVVLSVPS